MRKIRWRSRAVLGGVPTLYLEICEGCHKLRSAKNPPIPLQFVTSFADFDFKKMSQTRCHKPVSDIVFGTFLVLTEKREARRIRFGPGLSADCVQAKFFCPQKFFCDSEK